MTAEPLARRVREVQALIPPRVYPRRVGAADDHTGLHGLVTDAGRKLRHEMIKALRIAFAK
jgi:hypothetical protein